MGPTSKGFWAWRKRTHLSRLPCHCKRGLGCCDVLHRHDGGRLEHAFEVSAGDGNDIRGFHARCALCVCEGQPAHRLHLSRIEGCTGEGGVGDVFKRSTASGCGGVGWETQKVWLLGVEGWGHCVGRKDVVGKTDKGGRMRVVVTGEREVLCVWSKFS